MRVLVRADAGPVVGGGHVMRCLTLADALQRRGHTVSFQTNPDAIATVPALGNVTLANSEERADVVVVDHYAFSHADQRRLRTERQARLLVVLDDLADRSHDGDILVDSGAGREQDDYRGLVRADAEVLAGSRFALVRRDILAFREGSLSTRRVRAGGLSRIVIAFGLSDTTPLVKAAVAACSAMAPSAAVDVIVGPAAAENARAILPASSKVRLYVDPTDYASVLSRADLAIGGAGVSAFERCVLGLPSLAVCMASNQEINAAALARAGAARVIPNSSGLEETIGSALQDLANSPQTLLTMGRNAAGLCDGRGAERIVAALERPRPTPRSVDQAVTLRPAVIADARFVWSLRNEPDVRAWSRDPNPVDLHRHRGWFTARLNDPRTALFIAVRAGWPIGMIRFDRDGNEAEISIAISPLERRRGHGLVILDQGCRRVATSGFASSFRAVVRADNDASSRLFASSGFRSSEQSELWHTLRRAAPLADEQPGW